MKRVLIAAVALFILCVAGQAMALSQDEAQSIVAATGCTATVEAIEVPREGFNAFYSPMEHHIVTFNFSQLPETWQRFILYHETGHCLQWQRGESYKLRERGIHENEWDADAFAIQTLNAQGYDGEAINEELLSYVYRTWDAKGEDDDSHGTIVDRIIRGRLSRMGISPGA